MATTNMIYKNEIYIPCKGGILLSIFFLG